MGSQSHPLQSASAQQAGPAFPAEPSNSSTPAVLQAGLPWVLYHCSAGTLSLGLALIPLNFIELKLQKVQASQGRQVFTLPQALGRFCPLSLRAGSPAVFAVVDSDLNVLARELG